MTTDWNTARSCQKLGGFAPLVPLDGGNHGKWPPHDSLWPPLFISKSFQTLQMRIFTKTRQKNSHFWMNGEQFCAPFIFLCWASAFLYNPSFSLNFGNFYTYFCMWSLFILMSKGSNMAPSMVSRGCGSKAPHGSHRICYALGGRIKTLNSLK